MRFIKEKREKIIIIVALLLSVLLRIQNLWFPIGADVHSFRQTQTAITIQNFFNDGYRLLEYETPVLGQPWRVPLEFPIYQSVVYFVMKILHKTNIDVWCRLVSLCTFYLSVFFLKKTLDFFFEKKSVYCICFVYLFAPFTIIWSRAALIDYMSVLFALIYTWGLYAWLAEGKKTWMIALLFGCLGYLQKATTMFAFVFFLAYVILYYFYRQIVNQYKQITIHTILEYAQNNKTQIIELALLCVLPVIPGLCWTKYADIVKEQSVYTRGLTSEALHSWNYGTLEQKLSVMDWRVIWQRLTDYIGGIPVCLGLVWLSAKSKRSQRMGICCFVVIILTIFILFNLFYRHDYYMIMLTPFLSVVYGLMLLGSVERLSAIKHVGTVLSVAFVITFICIQMETNEHYLQYAMKMEARGSEAGWLVASGHYLGSITNPDERIVIQGEDWSSAILYYADRKGMMVTDEGQGTEEFFETFLAEENYTTLMTHSIDFAAALAEHYEVLVQYACPLDDISVYKFYQKMPLNQGNLIKIKYSNNIEEPLTVGIEFISVDGNSYYNTINLLADKDEIYYNIEDYCEEDDFLEKMQSILIDAPEGVQVSVEY